MSRINKNKTILSHSTYTNQLKQLDWNRPVIRNDEMKILLYLSIFPPEAAGYKNSPLSSNRQLLRFLVQITTGFYWDSTIRKGVYRMGVKV